MPPQGCAKNDFDGHAWREEDTAGQGLTLTPKRVLSFRVRIEALCGGWDCLGAVALTDSGALGLSRPGHKTLLDIEPDGHAARLNGRAYGCGDVGHDSGCVEVQGTWDLEHHDCLHVVLP